MHDAVHRTCPRCGEELVLGLDPDSPPDETAVRLLADPPFRYACESPGCHPPALGMIPPLD